MRNAERRDPGTDPVQWLLDGDPAIRWQTLRDLKDAPARAFEEERRRVGREGWGALLLALQGPSGRWGGLYTPKWTSATYTLLLLRDLGLATGHLKALQGCRQLLEHGFMRDGGIHFSDRASHSETCITGMVLSLLSYFGLKDARIERVVEHLLSRQMPDGGWNCRSYRGDTHGSFHTTILVLEGLREHEKSRGTGARAVREAQARGREFLLVHRLFRSDRTGKVVDPAMTLFSFPPRWHYDVLRALDHFRECGSERDARLEDAVNLVRRRRRLDGFWELQNRHRGRVHFDLEKVGGPSRWNTLRALRVLRWWEASGRRRQQKT